ncbi:hypothetical protein N2605_25310 [Bradyrhizobium yuanmingense]|uniref:hypothetical protein n=1 Tax=Bradyrhizobium yuanmingense TaxID=108015 RepID=UPI0021A400C8|nr:hypothetical protein [Bradyrhizobium sp. CB1024]UWU82890.1 hypothetical protein N2605_25310 [Bradyrhizobium sp. CB1024]
MPQTFADVARFPVELMNVLAHRQERITGADRAPHHENTDAKAMGEPTGSPISQARPAGFGTSRIAAELGRHAGWWAHGANVGTAVEEVVPSDLERSAGDLQPKASANLPRKLERGVGMAAIEERSIKLPKDAHSK